MINNGDTYKFQQMAYMMAKQRPGFFNILTAVVL